MALSPLSSSRLATAKRQLCWIASKYYVRKILNLTSRKGSSVPSRDKARSAPPRHPPGRRQSAPPPAAAARRDRRGSLREFLSLVEHRAEFAVKTLPSVSRSDRHSNYF